MRYKYELIEIGRRIVEQSVRSSMWNSSAQASSEEAAPDHQAQASALPVNEHTSRLESGKAATVSSTTGPQPGYAWVSALGLSQAVQLASSTCS